MVEQDRIIDGSRTAAGDVVIGLASSGPHSNGYSLIRKLVSVAGANDKTQLDGKSLFDRLLTPTRIYVKSMLALAQKINVKGFAHITGGGLTDNIPRVLPDGLEVVLQRRSWARDPVFDWLAADRQDRGRRDVSHLQLRHRHGGGGRARGCRRGAGVAAAPRGETGRRHRHGRRAARAASSSRNERMLPVAVVISGRGSNMEAIARAAQAPGQRATR